jgi:capsular polysaccharide biosynthesis protein
MQENVQCIEEDEIDLRELWKTLMKRKSVIIVVTLLITLAAVVYAFVLAKPVYAVKSVIEIGELNGKPIDNVNTIQQKLLYEYKVNATGIKRTFPLVKSISIPKKSRNLLSITIYGDNNTEAVKYIQTITNEIEKQYTAKTNAYLNNQKKLIKLTQQDIKDDTLNLKEMQKETNLFSKKIISLKRADAALAGIYVLQIGQQQTEIQDLKKNISRLKTKEQQLELSITPYMVKSTHIVGDIETLEKPVKPKKKLIVVVAFITGLILSVFLAFFLEFIGNTKEEK